MIVLGLKQRDRKILWAKAGNRCSYRSKDESCDKELVISKNYKNTVVGFECHIIGKKLNSPRYIKDYQKLDSYDNVILLCGTHHKLIDDKKNEKIYTVEILRKMKKEHEKSISNRIEQRIIKYPTELHKFFQFQELIYSRNFRKIFNQWHKFNIIFRKPIFSISTHFSQWRGFIFLQYKIDNKRINLKYEGSDFSCELDKNEKIIVDYNNKNFNRELDLFFESIEEVFT